MRTSEMKAAFRVDASLDIGSGHVMRCLTLADALKAQGADCHFISREHRGHLLEVIRQRGHAVTSLPAASPQPVVDTKRESAGGPSHAEWLGCDWQTDARQTGAILADLRPDWLAVDHYALDRRWEEAMAPHCRKVMVIDDLADRLHRCDLLLDQNLGRRAEHYAALVPAHCKLLIGPGYALLRPEFAALRPHSLQRRQTQPVVREVLVAMGGVDQGNATGLVLQALRDCALPPDCRITLVMGLAAPWLQDVRERAAQMPWPTEVVVNAGDMARRMAESDLAIGAAGSSSWERCCLGLPTVMVVVADNQRPAAEALGEIGAGRVIQGAQDIPDRLPALVNAMISSPLDRDAMSVAAAGVADGRGASIVIHQLES
jgi:UDP-2,4-diacetamido-2,4,6-trideoxy-beta-L-altropyranose hydrolase